MAILTHVACDGSSAVFQLAEERFVSVNRATHATLQAGSLEELGAAEGSWRVAESNEVVDPVLVELADAAVAAIDPVVATAVEPARRRRVYRVPRAVREEALRALGWREGLNRGGSNAGDSIARALCDAQSVDVELISRVARLAPRFSARSRERGWTFGTEGYPSSERVTWGLWGGDAGQRWAKRVVLQHRALTAAGDFEYDESCDYFGTGDDPDTTEVNGLYVHYPEDDTWGVWDSGAWKPADPPEDAPLVIQLDAESAKTVADSLESDPSGYVELQNLNPVERDLVNMAYSELDLGLLDLLSALTADAASPYTPQARSQDAQRQGRDSSGKFNPGSSSAPKQSIAFTAPRAQLPVAVAPVADVSKRIDEYVADVEQIALRAAGMPDPVEPPEPGSTVDVTPLYLAIVDQDDPQAVLDVVSIVSRGQDVTCWKRSDGAWVSAPDVLDSLRSISPPPVVELSDPELLNTVLQQVDAHDVGKSSDSDADVTPSDQAPMQASAAECSTPTSRTRERDARRGVALPDGSFPIRDTADLKKAVHALGRAKDAAVAKRHITKRARALGRTDLLPDDWKVSTNDVIRPLWGPYGESLASITAAGVPGVADTPQDEAAVERLHRYWLTGEGGIKIRWRTPGDWTRCHRLLSKYLGARSAGYCQLLHIKANGFGTGSRLNK